MPLQSPNLAPVTASIRTALSGLSGADGDDGKGARISLVCREGLKVGSPRRR